MLDDTVIIALVPGCVEVAKRTGLPPRYAPLAAILAALVLVMLARAANQPASLSIATAATVTLSGIIDGLAAIGLYRLVPKAVTETG
jgi:hypothetical protein